MITRRKVICGAARGFVSLPLLGLFTDLAKAQSSSNKFSFITFSFPNGCIETSWNFEGALTPLADITDKVVLYANVQNEIGERQGGDGHQQGGVNLFTGKRLVNDSQSGGYSIDQFISDKVFPSSPIPSLVQGVFRGWAGGSFRPITWSRRSWLATGQPVSPIVNPLDSFNKIFGIPQDRSDLFLKTRTSILDALLEQYNHLSGDSSKLGRESKEYLSMLADQVRTVEKDIHTFSQQKFIDTLSNQVPPPSAQLVNGMLEYEHFNETFKHQMDLVVLAIQHNISNCASLMFGSSGEEFKHPSMKITDHMSSHFANQDEFSDYIAYRKYHMSNLRYLIDSLASTLDTEGQSLLNSTIVLVGSEFGDGRSHKFSSQPHLVATGSSKFPTGTIVTSAMKSTDLYGSILETLEVDSEGFL